MGLARFIGRLFCPYSRRFFPSPKPGETEVQWLGRQGERLAAIFLRRKGYKILYRNFRAPRGGEVDLVCRHRKTLVFVEVKTRTGDLFGAPAEAVTLAKQRFIIKGALAWLQLLHHPEIACRFDVVEVTMTDERANLQVITDAFALPEEIVS